MHFFITSDSTEETRTGDVISRISGSVKKYFLEKNYGSSVEGIVIVFMCRDPKIAFKQRVRFSKKDKKLYIDIMLNYEFMLSALNDQARFNLMKEKLLTELSLIIKKYKFPEFDLEKFLFDLQNNLVLKSNQSVIN